VGRVSRWLRCVVVVQRVEPDVSGAGVGWDESAGAGERGAEQCVGLVSAREPVSVTMVGPRYCAVLNAAMRMAWWISLVSVSRRLAGLDLDSGSGPGLTVRVGARGGRFRRRGRLELWCRGRRCVSPRWWRTVAARMRQQFRSRRFGVLQCEARPFSTAGRRVYGRVRAIRAGLPSRRGRCSASRGRNALGVAVVVLLPPSCDPIRYRISEEETGAGGWQDVKLPRPGPGLVEADLAHREQYRHCVGVADGKIVKVGVGEAVGVGAAVFVGDGWVRFFFYFCSCLLYIGLYLAAGGCCGCLWGSASMGFFLLLGSWLSCAFCFPFFCLLVG